MKKRRSDFEDTLQPEYDLDKLEVVAYGPGWNKPRQLRKKGRKQALNPKLLLVTNNPRLARRAYRKEQA
jgi:hypothetical protein